MIPTQSPNGNALGTGSYNSDFMLIHKIFYEEVGRLGYRLIHYTQAALFYSDKEHWRYHIVTVFWTERIPVISVVR